MMIRKQIYRYEREGGGITLSPKKPPNGVGYQIRWRLIAEEGKAITDGTQTVTVVDVLHRKDCDNWTDCEPLEDDRTLPEPPADLLERE